MNLILIAWEIDRREFTNRVTTSLTLVGNSADARRLAQCRDTMYCNAERRASAAAGSGSAAMVGGSRSLSPGPVP